MTETTDHWNAIASRLEQRCLPEIVQPDETAREAAEALRSAASRVNGLPRYSEAEAAVADNWHSDMDDVINAVMELTWPEGGWSEQQRSIDARVFTAVRAERERQDAHWGTPKDLPNGTGRRLIPLHEVWLHTRAGISLQNADGEMLRTAAQHTTDHRTDEGTVTYADILTEEHFEALAEDDPEKLFDELIQVAAVAQKWCRALIEHQGVQR